MTTTAGAFAPDSAGRQREPMAPLVVGAIGVVFGDIGTSPLYTLRECFSGRHGLPLTPDNVLGILSVIFWAIMIVVTLKYVTLIMRADNRGEGGIMALTALASRGLENKRTRWWVVGFGIFGAAMFYGDGMITPAISVLSAVEGLEITAPLLTHYVVPLTLVILIGLFSIQRHGTARVGVFFGPVMCLWFVTIGVLGAIEIATSPTVLAALNPSYAIRFLVGSPLAGFLALGAVVLAVTGTEALYADMGHFGAKPIQRAWLFFVLPSPRAQLFRSGCADHPRRRRDQEPVLSARAGMGPSSDGRACDLCDGHRIAGRHLGRILVDATGHTNGILPTSDDYAHVRARDRPDLCAVHQLDAAARCHAARRGFSKLKQSGCGLWHRRDPGDVDRFDSDLRCHDQTLALEPIRRICHCRPAGSD
jgi:hypothetical protein